MIENHKYNTVLSEPLESRLLFSVLLGPITNTNTGHVYYLLNPDTWLNSEEEAKSLGGHLATINNAAENQWVFDTFHNFGGVARGLWIGLTDEIVEGQFAWISSAPVKYLNWNGGQPDNNANDDYAHLLGHSNPSRWNDLPNDPTTIPGLNFPPTAGVVEVVHPKAEIQGNKLLVRGGKNDDTISVTQDGDDLVVQVNDFDETFNASEVARIRVYGFKGDDDVTIESDLPAKIWGHAGRDTLRGGGGADRIEGGIGSDSIFGFAGNDTLFGRSGRDTLIGGLGDDDLSGGIGVDDLIEDE